MKCPNCNNETSEASAFCRKCGKPLHDDDPKTKRLPRGPNIDLKAIGRSSVRCAAALALSAIVVHFATALGVLPFTVTASPAKRQPDDGQGIYIIQAIIAGLFLVLLFTPMGLPRKGKLQWDHIARETFHQFLKGWSAIWVTWLVLYIYLGLVPLIFKDLAGEVYFQVTVDFLNVSNSVAFFYVFLVLDMPSVSTKADPERNREFKKGFAVVSVICFLVFLFSSYSRFIKTEAVGTVGIYLSGILVAISMSYVFGRLDSHHMNVKRWMLAPLYLYAVIQVIGPILIDYSGEVPVLYQTLFFATALCLKIYLFIVITYWLQNGSFEEYFNTASKYIEEMRAKREASGI